MDIHTIDVQYFATASMNTSHNGLKHVKSLPYLSVVQATEGFYSIGMGSDNQIKLNEMGAFIAPAYQMQYITHYTNSVTNNMAAHWIFLDVIINHQYRLDELFHFPLVLPKKYENDLCKIIETVATLDLLCLKLSEIYQLIQILIDIGTQQKFENNQSHMITSFIKKHLAEKLSHDILARELNVSVPTLYRIFKQTFNMSPANYVNSIRLMQSVSLLETTDKTITEISEIVGFYDQPFFSRLFKNKYGISPSEYRKKVELI